MLETPHVAVGVALASKIPNPWIALPFALASHFILDKIPHWNPHTYTETAKNGHPSKQTVAIAVFDALVALTFGSYFAYLAMPNTSHALTILAASFFSVLPDVSKYPYFLIKNLRKGLYKKWVDYERALQEDAGLLPGLASQAIIIIAALIWIFN